jgi:hypothetical protein
MAIFSVREINQGDLEYCRGRNEKPPADIVTAEQLDIIQLKRSKEELALL